MDDGRPNPDALLASIQKQEARQSRGKLKVFLGMAAGVGKTYTMLQEGQTALDDGVDVVVGYIETHGRIETEALLEGLEIVPRQRVDYRGSVLEEMDLDGVLARKPQLVLVDELAHTNAPGLRHAKRYQDVLELLDAGIDVHTTVNVQHFESRADAVRQITGATIHETVPDSILDLADAVELVDLTPEELRKRLSEGKVYTPDRADVAARNFFRTGNLTALREMALRLTAEHVDHQLQDYMDIKRISGPWKSGERLMVAVGPSPFSEKLIRWTRRMAYNLEAPWIAANVETTKALTEEAQQQLRRNLLLARNLGAEIVTTAGDNVAGALILLARQRNVTQVVVGKPKETTWQKVWRQHSLVDRVIEESGDIDVYVVTGDEPDGRRGMALTLPRLHTHSPLNHYLWAGLITIGTTLLDLLVVNRFPLINYLAVGLTDLLVVLLIAIWLGRGPALLAATLTAVTWNFLFIEPRFTFQISQAQDLILFLLYFAIAVIAGNLAARLRSQQQLARHHAERTSALYSLAHETASAVDMDAVLQVAVHQVNAAFDADSAVFLAEGDRLQPAPHPAGTLDVSEKDRSVAVWTFENRKAAGRFTETLPLAGALFVPLRSPTRVVGVMGVRTRHDFRPSIEQDLLMETFATQIALAIEREMLDEAAEHNAMLQESERLFTTLLNSISHELRTPIATISGAASSLLDSQTGGNPNSRAQLAGDIQDAAERLNRLVANLLDMSRLESGRLRLKLEWCDVGEVISVAVKRLEKRLAQRALTISIAPDMPLVQMDFVLMEQVITNLLDNAWAYTPADSPIEIGASWRNGTISITITDHGPGINETDLPHIFDKFYRAPATSTGGTGLGLSISRGLVEAHGGTLSAANIPGAGACFTIKLLATSTPPPVPEARL